MNRLFWLTFIAAAMLCAVIVQFSSRLAVGVPMGRPPLPIPGRQYVSATRDGQTDQSLFYFDMFGFGARIRTADVIVLGSSHAQFGIDATMFGGSRPFNLGLGGGESLHFAAVLLEKYRPMPSLTIIDPFATDSPGLSTEARRVVASTRGESYRWVFDIWAGFVRDWALQGILPRATISAAGVKLEQSIGTTIIRDWHTGEVTAVYTEIGELYADPNRGRSIRTGPPWPGYAPYPADLLTIRKASKSIIVTNLPYPSYDDKIPRDVAGELGAVFVSMSSDGILFWDFHHLDAAGRHVATSRLVQAIASNSRN
jgi:hypothetical protein